MTTLYCARHVDALPCHGHGHGVRPPSRGAYACSRQPMGGGSGLPPTVGGGGTAATLPRRATVVGRGCSHGKGRWSAGTEPGSGGTGSRGKCYMSLKRQKTSHHAAGPTRQVLVLPLARRLCYDPELPE
jgi:hypothetical protein